MKAMLALLLATLPLVALAQPANMPKNVRYTLNFYKAADADTSATVQFVPASCPACRDNAHPDFARDNIRETTVDLQVPTKQAMTLQFTAPAGLVRRVTDPQQNDLHWQQDGSTITVHVLAQTRNGVGAGQLQTEINEPSLAVRIEHADEARRAGPYAEGPFPWRQRAAAVNLQFAQRAMVKRSGLHLRLEAQGGGQIRILGFDTNYPHGHSDDPPHMHMYLRWPTVTGSQVGHYYLDEDGLLVDNWLTMIGMPKIFHMRLGKGEPHPTHDANGRHAYTHTITQEGWLRLKLEGSAECLLRPLQPGKGFDTGVQVECPGQATYSVTAHDDYPNGVLTATTDGVTEVWRYDVDTGKVLSGLHWVQ